MKKFYIVLFLFVSCLSFAQDCRQGKFEKQVLYGELSTMLRTNGDLFWNGQDSKAGYVNQDGSITSLFFAGGIWMGGKTKSGEVKFSGTTYRTQNENFDFYPGPLDNSGNTIKGNCEQWDRIFSVTRQDVLSTIDIVYNGGEVPNLNKCDEIPISLKMWPGSDNPHFKEIFGFSLPFGEFASFFDYDNDGVYDPCRGDLPILEKNDCDIITYHYAVETFPSQLHYWIFNDNGGPQLLSDGGSLKMEVQSYFFTFDNEEGKDLGFYKFKLLNKGIDPLDSFFFSMWLDPDLGCYNDDYIGAYKDDNLVFIYNSDENDGFQGTNCGDLPTFGNQIPMAGISYLKGLNDLTGKDYGLTSNYITENCGTGLLPNFPCDPSGEDKNFYNTMSSNSILFNGNPANLTENSMCSEAVSIGDRRVVVSTGGIPMDPGDVREVIIATSAVKNVPHPCPDNTAIINANKRANKLYENCWKSSNLANTKNDKILNTPWAFLVTSNGFKINNVEENIFLEVSDISGRILYTKSLSQNEELEWNTKDYDINNSMIFVKINSKKMGMSKSYKIVLFK